MNTLDFSRRKVSWPNNEGYDDWNYLPWELWDLFNPAPRVGWESAWFADFAICEGCINNSLGARLVFTYT